MSKLVSVSPFRCRVWSMHARIEDYITEDSCKAEIESFEANGQRVPALGRRIHDPGYDFEIICGARRLFVARHLNVPLLLELREMSDRDALIALDAENRHRRDISAYERGQSYARWLREKLFRSQDEMASALQISPSRISRLLRIARLPSTVIDAFGDKAEIREGWGRELARVLEDATLRPALMKTAKSISERSPRPSAREVYKRLKSVVRREEHDDEVMERRIAAGDGGDLFRIRRRPDSVIFILPAKRVAPHMLAAIESLVARVLELQVPQSRAASSDLRGDPAVQRSIQQ